MQITQGTALKRLSAAFKRSRSVGSLWSQFRGDQLLSRYRERRDNYEERAGRLGLAYDPEGTKVAVTKRLADRGYSPNRKLLGDVHTYAMIPMVGWHPALLPDLGELGRVSLFDYTKLDIHPAMLHRLDATAVKLRGRINEAWFDDLARIHREDPVDWVYVYASGLETEAKTLRRITDELGIPLVNMCLDDKQSWEGQWLGNQRIGQIDIAAEFDLSWTSARVACGWYLVEGGRPIHLPEGFDATQCRPISTPTDLGVSFIGEAYGFRPNTVRSLRKRGLRVEAFGDGWENPAVWGEEQVRVINRSLVNLGFGGIGYCESLTNVKTRDFEIPGTGGGAYLTSFNAELAEYFEIGTEILCYRSEDELIEQASRCLQDLSYVREMSTRARIRCLKEHRWIHRYRTICEILGILKD